MTTRVKRITELARGSQQIDLPWSGTSHAVGAKLLREYAERIGLKSAFTIHDRSDAADLMNLVRQDLGLSATKITFSVQGHVPEDLFVRRQFANAIKGCIGKTILMVRHLEAGIAKALSQIYGSETPTGYSRL